MPRRSDFEKEAGRKRQSFLSEFGQFLATNKKWWMIPILVLLLLVAGLLLVGGSGAAPFIYTLF